MVNEERSEKYKRKRAGDKAGVRTHEPDENMEIKEASHDDDTHQDRRQKKARGDNGGAAHPSQGVGRPCFTGNSGKLVSGKDYVSIKGIESSYCKLRKKLASSLLIQIIPLNQCVDIDPR